MSLTSGLSKPPSTSGSGTVPGGYHFWASSKSIQVPWHDLDMLTGWTICSLGCLSDLVDLSESSLWGYLTCFSVFPIRETLSNILIHSRLNIGGEPTLRVLWTSHGTASGHIGHLAPTMSDAEVGDEGVLWWPDPPCGHRLLFPLVPDKNPIA